MTKVLAMKVVLIAIAAALALAAAPVVSDNLSVDAALAVFIPDNIHFP